MKKTLAGKIENKQAVVGVIGLGYVGLPLLKAFHAAGYPVVGFDVDGRKIESLKADAIISNTSAATWLQPCSRPAVLMPPRI